MSAEFWNGVLEGAILLVVIFGLSFAMTRAIQRFW